MAKDFHCVMKEPHESMLSDIAQKLWESHGNYGEAVQYDSVAARHCIMTTHKAMFPEKHKKIQ